MRFKVLKYGMFIHTEHRRVRALRAPVVPDKSKEANMTVKDL